MSHGVNIAQALKTSAVWWRINGNQTFIKSSIERMNNLDNNYGMASGMFCADELLCKNNKKHPSRGSELCAVVESMFSYSYMFSTFGNVSFADRVERIAYNALPATFASKLGGDMWNHQYFQANNEISAKSQFLCVQRHWSCATL